MSAVKEARAAATVTITGITKKRLERLHESLNSVAEAVRVRVEIYRANGIRKGTFSQECTPVNKAVKADFEAVYGVMEAGPDYERFKYVGKLARQEIGVVGDPSKSRTPTNTATGSGDGGLNDHETTGAPAVDSLKDANPVDVLANTVSRLKKDLNMDAADMAMAFEKAFKKAYKIELSSMYKADAKAA